MAIRATESCDLARRDRPSGRSLSYYKYDSTRTLRKNLHSANLGVALLELGGSQVERYLMAHFAIATQM